MASTKNESLWKKINCSFIHFLMQQWVQVQRACKTGIMNSFPGELHAEPVLFKQRESINRLLQTTMSTAFESSLACSPYIRPNVCKYLCFCMFTCTSSKPLTFNVTWRCMNTTQFEPNVCFSMLAKPLLKNAISTVNDMMLIFKSRSNILF